MTEGKARDAAAVLQGGQPVRLHLQLGLRLAPGDRVLLLGPPAPPGARGLDRRLPTLGTGALRVAGLPVASDEHPHDVGGPGGLLLNWNNRSAPGFMHGDDEPYGSVQRVELFDKFPRRGQAHRRRRHHEPRGDRGRPLAGLAGRQPACCTTRPGAQRARRAGRRPARRLGPRATRRASTPTTTASTTRPARRSWTSSVAPARRRRSCARCSATCSTTSTTSAAWAA